MGLFKRLIYGPRKTYNDKNGYLRWKNSNDLVHRWVAKKHIYYSNRDKYPLPFGAYQIHHKNGNKVDNRVSNLKILTQKEHKYEHTSFLRKLFLTRPPS